MAPLLEKRLPVICKVVWMIWAVMVITGSLLPGDNLPSVPVGDKVEHFTAYFGLTILPPLFLGTKRWIYASPFLMVLLGICMEIAQIWIPGRTCDIMDALANSIGAAVGFPAGLIAAKILYSRSPTPTASIRL
jgi:VanZ family protein